VRNLPPINHPNADIPLVPATTTCGRSPRCRPTGPGAQGRRPAAAAAARQRRAPASASYRRLKAGDERRVGPERFERELRADLAAAGMNGSARRPPRHGPTRVGARSTTRSAATRRLRAAFAALSPADRSELMKQSIVSAATLAARCSAAATSPGRSTRGAERARRRRARRAARRRAAREMRPQARRAGGKVDTTGGVAVIPLRGLIVPRASFLSMLFGGGGGLIELPASAARGGRTTTTSPRSCSTSTRPAARPTCSPRRRPTSAPPARRSRSSPSRTRGPRRPPTGSPRRPTSSSSRRPARSARSASSAAHEDWSKFNDELGVKPTYISAGKYKTEGNPDEPLSDDARAAYQADDRRVLRHVRRRRREGPRRASASTVRRGYGEGRMVTAKNASPLGMADRVDTLEATIARVVTRAAARHPQGRRELAPDPAADDRAAKPAATELPRATPSPTRLLRAARRRRPGPARRTSTLMTAAAR
jgi:hypothetical protein